MRSALRSRLALSSVLLGAVMLAACTTTAPPKADPTVCVLAAANDPLIGTWLSVRQEKGIAGELHTLFVLNADGTMSYAERLKRGRHPTQGLSETGCWERQAGGFTLRTLASNGSPVDPGDPLFVNQYTVQAVTGDRLTLDYQGSRLQVRRMSPGYRLPL